MSELIAYKKGKALIYLTNQNVKNEMHFVPERNWDTYMQLRKTTPKKCIIYDKVEEAYLGAQKEG